VFVYDAHHSFIDWASVELRYEGGDTAIECRRAFGISKQMWYDAVERGDLILRAERFT
jgi:hypothetical protein